MMVTGEIKTYYVALNPEHSIRLSCKKENLAYVWYEICHWFDLSERTIFGVKAPSVHDHMMWDPFTDVISFEITTADITYCLGMHNLERLYPGLFMWDYTPSIPRKDGR